MGFVNEGHPYSMFSPSILVWKCFNDLLTVGWYCGIQFLFLIIAVNLYEFLSTFFYLVNTTQFTETGCTPKKIFRG